MARPHPYECQKVDFLAFVLGFFEAFLEPFNTFMTLDNPGNQAGREKVL